MKISIIQFSVENFKIFKERITFYMFASKSEHTFKSRGENLLRTSLIYGPNATGKSSVLEAMQLMKSIVLKSAELNKELPYVPFLLSEKIEKPCFFELAFALDEKLLRYNFSFNKEEILEENLFEIKGRKQIPLLVRKKQNIELFFKEDHDILSRVRKDALCLSVLAQWNNELSLNIIEGFKNINIINASKDDLYSGYTVKLFREDEDAKKTILNLLREADFSIVGGSVEKIDFPKEFRKELPFEFKQVPESIDTVFFEHEKFSSKGEKIGIQKFNLGEESLGTQKLFHVLGPAVDTIQNGKVLLVDEFDNSLHPFLTKFIVDLFEKRNPKNGQLIGVTHDTSLLSYDWLIKDQFWFTEKDRFGAGHLFSLAEFDIRNDAKFSKKYFEGRFGAIPFINIKGDIL